MRLFDLARREGQGEEHAIDAPVLQGFDRILAGLFAQEQFEIGPLLAQARQESGEHKGRDRGDHAHAQLACKRFARSLHQVRKLFRLAQNAMRLFHHLIAQRREADHPAAAFDQRHAEQRFEFADPRAQCRLRHEARFRGAAEMAVFVQRHKILQLLDGREVGAHRFALTPPRLRPPARHRRRRYRRGSSAICRPSRQRPSGPRRVRARPCRTPRNASR